jgi:hypothetical protein
MKAIETRYDGYRSPSRRARWAVFFNTAGIRYEFEPEGFEIPETHWVTEKRDEYGNWDEDGGYYKTYTYKYLPDFWLPDFKLFIEIKGCEPSEKDRHKIDLFRKSGYKIKVAIGLPGAGMKELVEMITEYELRNALTEDDVCFLENAVHRRLNFAFEAAKSARFEHGESPHAAR